MAEIVVMPKLGLLMETGTVGAWKAAGKPAELHVYDQVSAGFGLSPRGRPVDGWIDRMHEWLLARELTR